MDRQQAPAEKAILASAEEGIRTMSNGTPQPFEDRAQRMSRLPIVLASTYVVLAGAAWIASRYFDLPFLDRGSWQVYVGALLLVISLGVLGVGALVRVFGRR